MESLYTHFNFNNVFKDEYLHLPSADVYQIAELSLIQTSEIGEHIQICDEITYVVSGKAKIHTGNQNFTLKANQIHYLKSGETHRITADLNEDFHYYCIGFIPSADYSIFEEFYNTTKNSSSFVIDDKNNIFNFFNSIINELFLSDNKSVTMIHYYLCQIIITINRILTATSKAIDNTNMHIGNQTIYKTLKYIDENYLRLERVKEIADTLNYSEYYLSHAFKEKLGINIKTYVIQKKVSTAAELLITSNMTINEIANHLHFSSPHSFGIAFKRIMNMSASDFRSTYQAKQIKSTPPRKNNTKN